MTKEEILKHLEVVKDPEVPVLNIIDLGIVRQIHLDDSSGITIQITPTYSGCPAMDLLAAQIQLELEALGFKPVVVEEILSPAWTTDWMTEEGKQKLLEYGIAPPRLSSEEENIQCPQCQSSDVRMVSQFGSTSCKALYQCNVCGEPFDYFKCI